MNVLWKLLSCFAALTTIASGCQSQTSPPQTEASALVDADGHDHAEHRHDDGGETEVTLAAVAKLKAENGRSRD